MRLLVSVGDASEALAALRGGADLIDAKDARSGALEPVSSEALAGIVAAVAGRRPVTAALGDAADGTTIEDLARSFAAAGTAFVKVGFAGVQSAGRARALLEAAARGARTGNSGTAVVAVAYADYHTVESLRPHAVADAARASGARGLLIDTADKTGPGLCELAGPRTLAAWVAGAHSAGLFVALAGKLTSEDLGRVHQAGADIAGVRGAACEGGRIGKVVTDRVHELRERCDQPAVAVSS